MKNDAKCLKCPYEPRYKDLELKIEMVSSTEFNDVV